MKGAFGALHWTPEIFWRSTLTEYMLAIEGFNEAQGAEKPIEAPDEDELAALVAKYG